MTLEIVPVGGNRISMAGPVVQTIAFCVENFHHVDGDLRSEERRYCSILSSYVPYRDSQAQASTDAWNAVKADEAVRPPLAAWRAGRAVLAKAEGRS